MKKKFSLILIIFTVLSFFTGCSNKLDFPSNYGEGTVPVKELTVSIFNTVDFSDIGYANKNGFYLSRRCLNGYAKETDSKYIYSSVENFEEVTKGAKGILIYKGLAYAVKTENGKDYLTVISDHAAHYLREYELSHFKDMAINYHKAGGSTYSGGDGLLDDGRNTSG